MELNSLLFPAPPSSYTSEDLEGECMYIPRFFQFNKPARRNIEKHYKEQLANE